MLIYGKGTITGDGRTLARAIIEDERIRLRSYLEESGDKVQACENLDTVPERVRGWLISMSNCRSIHITGLTLRTTPAGTSI